MYRKLWVVLTLWKLLSPNLGYAALVRSLSTEWMENLSEWTESCLVDGRGMSHICMGFRYSDYRAVDWASYGEVLQASSRIMDSIANHVTTLKKTKAIRLPILVAENVRDRKYVPWSYLLI